MTDTDDETLDYDEDLIAAQIKCYLEVYPVLSPTMLQAALGPQTKPGIWRPVLEEMVKNGIIVKDTVPVTTPSGRHRDFATLSLKK